MDNTFKWSFFKYLVAVFILLVHASQGSMTSENVAKECNGTISQCTVMEEELLMESDISRRFLAEARRRYLSNRVLKRNQAACGNSGRGQAYSPSCLPKPSNPSKRPCKAYYGCKGGGS